MFRLHICLGGALIYSTMAKDTSISCLVSQSHLTDLFQWTSTFWRKDPMDYIFHAFIS